MSRNPREDQYGTQHPAGTRNTEGGDASLAWRILSWCWLGIWLTAGASLALAQPAPKAAARDPGAPPPSRVVIAGDPAATDAFHARPEVVREMVELGIARLTGKSGAAAWASLVSPKDVVGIKIYSAPGPSSGTRPAVVAAVIEGLLEAKVPATNIIIWDRQKGDLRLAGFDVLAARYGVRLEGAVNAGFDEGTYYSPDNPILGQLVWSDLEFGRKGDGVGRRSFVSKLLVQGMTKIINITPLLNHNSAGVCGNLYSLAAGSVDNVLRFESDSRRLATAVPEIYALPSIGDRVVLNITDALICQYHGEQRSLLHYSTVLNELRFSKDPVALDLLSLRELDRERSNAGTTTSLNTSITNFLELIQNASLLELGAGELDKIKIEKAP